MADRTAPVVKLTLTLTILLPGTRELQSTTQSVEHVKSVSRL